MRVDGHSFERRTEIGQPRYVRLAGDTRVPTINWEEGQQYNGDRRM